MKNGWTGGQYSLFRALLGAYLAVHFASLAPYAAEVFSRAGVLPDARLSPLAHAFPNVLALVDAPAFVVALIVLAALGSVLLAVGAWDRIAALALAYIWACLFGRNPLIANPSLPYVGWMLVAHALIPGKPYGALAARGRVDPRGGWSMPGGIFIAAWIALALGYTYSGWTKLVSPSWIDGSAMARVLENPLARPGWVREALLGLPPGVLAAATWGALGLELAFAPLALLRRTRPLVWCAMLAMHVGLIAVVDFADLSFGMVLMHALTFDPAWVRPRPAPGVERVFFDGTCGVCHGFVRFTMAEDRTAACRFAPLQGETFAASLPAERRAELPDSIVVLASDGRLLVRSSAVAWVLERLGGAWRILGVGLRVVPQPLRDLGYDGVARVRRRLLAAPKTACPLVTADLASRFDA